MVGMNSSSMIVPRLEKGTGTPATDDQIKMYSKKGVGRKDFEAVCYDVQYKHSTQYTVPT